MTQAVAAPAPAEAPNPAEPTGAPSPAPSPAPAPAPAEPAPLNLGEATPPAPPPPADDIFEYSPTGDTALDVALEFVGARGFGPEHPAIKAATSGDFGPLEAALKAAGDKAKGFERIVALAKDAHSRGVEKAKTQETTTRQTVETAVGGAANWAAIQTWASANADAGEKAEINAMLKAGGLQARLAAQGLAQLYNAQLKTRPPAPALKEGATNQPASSGTLTPQEYAKEVGKLHGKLGSRLEGSAEYAALKQRVQLRK